jgi:hypothetical protein
VGHALTAEVAWGFGLCDRSWFDPAAAEGYAASLPVGQLLEERHDKDAEELEKAGLPRTSRVRAVKLTQAKQE